MADKLTPKQKPYIPAKQKHGLSYQEYCDKLKSEEELAGKMFRLDTDGFVRGIYLFAPPKSIKIYNGGSCIPR